jgi:NAD(P)-dependent dehydrogenase (short-subunit alcohol dehydrogenase family)
MNRRIRSRRYRATPEGNARGFGPRAARSDRSRGDARARERARGLPLRTVSKAGLLGLTRNAARELGPHGVRVNAILPGIVDNPRGRGLIERHARGEGIDYGTTARRVLGFVSMRTLIAPEEIADVAVFLATDRARHVTGQFISVDGNEEWES